MSGWHEGLGRLNQGEEYASIRVIITFMTTLGLELHEVQLRIIHFRDGKGEYLSFSSLPRCGHGLPYRESFPTILPGGTHAGSKQIFLRALGKKQEVGRRAEVKHSLSNDLWAELVLNAEAGMKSELRQSMRYPIQ